MYNTIFSLLRAFTYLMEVEENLLLTFRSPIPLGLV